MPYRVAFENKPTATAPAQLISVTDLLDPNLDLSTFQLTDITLANQTIAIPPGLNHYEAMVPITAATNEIMVDFEVKLDMTTRTLSATFMAVDPLTGWFPADPLVGLLYPDDDSGRGQGSIGYLVYPKPGLPTGTTISNKASIVFDYNDPIETPTVFNTIDSGAPASRVLALPLTTNQTVFQVEWSGEDDAGGSGVASYDLYVSDNSGAWTQWLTRSTNTSALFTGQPDHTYGFYSAARDNAGNLEPAHSAADTVVSIIVPTRIIGLSGDLAFGNVVINTTATRTLTITNSGNTALTVSNIDYPPGFNGGWSSGTIAAGSWTNVTVTFIPTAVTDYAGSLTVDSDATSGDHRFEISGAGVPATAVVTLNQTTLDQVYDGSPKVVTASTTPPGLTVMVTYNGSATPPTAAGIYSILATVSDPNYTGSASGTLTVRKAVPSIVWATPADIMYGTALGTSQLNATANVPGSFAYSPSVGTLLNAGSGQTLSATFTPNDTVNYQSATANVRINVLKATPIITWPTPADITYGTALGANQLNATANVPGSFAYSPSAGTVLNAGSGQTLSVTFTPDNTVNYQNATANVRINVLKATPIITWPTPADITYGTALGANQLNATANVPGSFAYSPSAGTLLNAGSGQTLSVTFTPDNTVNYQNATANVRINVLKATPIITWPTPADITYGTALGANELNAIANVPGSFAYSPSAGTVLNAGSGQTLSVTFTPDNTVNYQNATANVRINVLKATPIITWPTPADITYGTALGANQLNATANVPGSFAYSPSAGTLLNAGSGQILSATFTPNDTVNYQNATANVSINVLKATPIITWPAPADITYGTALGANELNAAANVPGSFAYSPSAGTVLNAGSGQILSATFTPNDTVNYQNATANVSINVLKATPIITWPAPADITYGTALGTNQLNATANVPGSFAYSPPAGTVLNAGSGQILSATFTPNDTVNYQNATASVSINVLLVAPSITAQPVSLTVTQGDSASFSVTAGGSAPLSYQWWFNGTNMIAEATLDTLTLNNIVLAQAGGYSVEVTNTAGSVTSLVARLTVLVPPTISDARLIGQTFRVSLATAAGAVYTLEYRNSLAGVHWAVADSIPGTGAYITLSDSIGTNQSRFYRVRVQ